MRRRRKGPTRSLERVPRRAGDAENPLGTFVVGREVGVTQGPIHAESIDARGSEGGLGEAVRLALIVQRRAAEPKHPRVPERPAP